MNDIDLFVFSGTGNTLKIARSMRETFESSNINCKIKSITSSFDPANIDLDNVIGIAFPIACFSSYPVVWDFINSLPQTNSNTKLFILSTFAGNDGQVCAQIAPIVISKGYDLIGYEGFIMPNNFLVRKINPEANSKLNELGMKRAAEYANRLIQTKSPFKYRGKISSILFKLVYKLSFLTGLHKKIFKLRLYKEKCNGCGICAKLCPVGNITVTDGKAVFGEKCQICMRCIGFCPENAISLRDTVPYKACSYQDFISSYDD